MSWAIVILGLLLLISAGLFALRFFYRSEDALETRMLKARIEALGIDPRLFSQECLAELIERGCGTKFRQTMGRTAAIESVAVNVAWVCFGKQGYTAPEIKAELDRGYPHGHTVFFWNVLSKHHPEKFALDELDRTQSRNNLFKAEMSLRA